MRVLLAPRGHVLLAVVAVCLALVWVAVLLAPQPARSLSPADGPHVIHTHYLPPGR
jgi:hypothetical protein